MMGKDMYIEYVKNFSTQILKGNLILNMGYRSEYQENICKLLITIGRMPNIINNQGNAKLKFQRDDFSPTQQL